MMRRDECLKLLARHHTDEIVVPVYQAAFEWRAIKPDSLIYLGVGAMGQASSHALGLALGRPDKRVIVLDGDGSLLMNLGSLVTIAEGRAAQPHPLRLRKRHVRGQRRPPDSRRWPLELRGLRARRGLSQRPRVRRPCRIRLRESARS